MKNAYKCLAFVSVLLLSSCEISFGGSLNSHISSGSNQGETSNNGGETSNNGGETSNDPTSNPAEDPNLLWHDEFDGTSLNETYWNYQIGDGSQYGIPGWGNGELQYYQRDNTAVEDGNLVITARREEVGGKYFTSSRITTAGKVKVLYGRVEARMALPIGTAMWPAFWMLPESDSPYGGWPNSGEIDIMEARGRETEITTGALHFTYEGTSNHRYESASYTLPTGTIADYHVYAVEWERDQIRWYVDDALFMSINSNQWWSGSPNATTDGAPFDWDFHILFNFAIGGQFDGYRNPDASFQSAEMKVDYVRVYRL